MFEQWFIESDTYASNKPTGRTKKIIKLQDRGIIKIFLCPIGYKHLKKLD